MPALLAGIGLLYAPTTYAAADRDASGEEVIVEPALVNADILFGGADVRVRTIVPAGYEIAVVLLGNEEDLTVNRIGKSLGLLWMNVGEVHFSHVAPLYLLVTSASLSLMAAPAELDRAGIGYEAIMGRVTVAGEGCNKQWLLEELLKLRERDALFSVHEGVVRQDVAGADKMLASVTLHIPAKIPMGSYKIQVCGFRQGQRTLLREGELVVKPAGMVGLISSFSRQHGSLYGILAVSVALVVGLFTGFVFGLGSGKSH